MKLERLKFSSLADAKAKFSRVVEEAKNGEIVVTKNGVPAVVVMDYDRYVKIMKFLDEVRDLYLLDTGDLGILKSVEIDFEDFEEV